MNTPTKALPAIIAEMRDELDHSRFVVEVSVEAFGSWLTRLEALAAQDAALSAPRAGGFLTAEGEVYREVEVEPEIRHEFTSCDANGKPSAPADGEAEAIAVYLDRLAQNYYGHDPSHECAKAAALIRRLTRSAGPQGEAVCVDGWKLEEAEWGRGDLRITAPDGGSLILSESRYAFPAAVILRQLALAVLPLQALATPAPEGKV
jgi:hypothetical protein